MSFSQTLRVVLCFVALMSALPRSARAEAALAWRGLADPDVLLKVCGSLAANQVNEFTVTPLGEWVLVATVNGHAVVEHSRGFPSAVLTWIENYIASGRTIDAVAVSRTGGWVVIAQDYLRRTTFGITDSQILRDVFDRYAARGVRVTDFTFDADGDGWALVAGGEVYARNMPADLYGAVLDCREGGRNVRQISMAPDGRWIVAAENWYGGRGVPTALRNYLSDWQRRGDLISRVALTPDKVGFYALSDEFGVLDPSVRLNRVEQNLVVNGANSNIWERMAFHHTVGVSIAEVRGGRVVSSRGYGVLEAGTERFVRPDSLFDAASISKSISAALAMALVERGLLDLDEPIVNVAYDDSRVLPDNALARWIEYSDDTLHKPISQNMTLRHLLSHGADLIPHGSRSIPSGASVPDTYEMLIGYSCGSASSCATDADFAVQKSKGSTAEPGDAAAFHYSGGGFLVAQALMEAVLEGTTGQSFDEAMDELVFLPVGMDRSTFMQPLPDEFSGEVMLQHDELGVLIPARRRLIYPWKTAGGLYSTASDLGRFIIMLSQRGVGETGMRALEVASVRAMTTRARDNAGNYAVVLGTNYGLGLELSVCNVGWNGWTVDRRPARISHGGVHNYNNFPTVRTRMVYNPETEEGFVVLVTGGAALDLVQEIEAAYVTEAGWSAVTNDLNRCSDPQTSPWYTTVPGLGDGLRDLPKF